MDNSEYLDQLLDELKGISEKHCLLLRLGMGANRETRFPIFAWESLRKLSHFVARLHGVLALFVSFSLLFAPKKTERFGGKLIHYG